MTSEAKPTRKVRFSLPDTSVQKERANDKHHHSVKPSHDKRHSISHENKSTSASTHKKRNSVSVERGGPKVLPKIVDNASVAKQSKSLYSKSQKNLTSSKSLTDKKTRSFDQTRRSSYSSVQRKRSLTPQQHAKRPVTATSPNGNLLKVPQSNFSNLFSPDEKFLDLPDHVEDDNFVGVLGDLSRLGLSSDKNEKLFWEYVNKWCTNLNADKNKKPLHSENQTQSHPSSRTGSRKSVTSSNPVQNTSRLKAFKMNLDQVTLITPLLRACRDGNDQLLKEIISRIAVSGISTNDLNMTDKSGRTALSYLCSTNLYKYLELLLELPVDVNKADNELNTPLHYAAQAGQAEAVNLLITKSHRLILDAKNNLGFTPLMKAALQGRTRCAKLLLFAGASPIDIDTGRGLRADQWARFCSHRATAEMIEQFMHNRALESTTSSKHKTFKSDSTEGAKQSKPDSKFRKVFSFSFSTPKSKPQKSISQVTEKENKQAEMRKRGEAKQPGVPKLEVTYANNSALIKKYETIYGKYHRSS